MAVNLMKETKLPRFMFFLRRLSGRWPLILEDFIRIHEDIFQSIIYWRITLKGPRTSPSLGIVPSAPLPAVAISIVTVVTRSATALVLISDVNLNFPRAVSSLFDGDIALHFFLIICFKLSVREVSGEDFRTACAQDGAVVIVDAGFTEIAPDSATVCALRRPIA